MAQFGRFQLGRNELGRDSSSTGPSFGAQITFGATIDGTRIPAPSFAVQISFGASFSGTVLNTANARVTQVAREVLQQGGSPNARVTQVAREVLVRLGATFEITVSFGALFTGTNAQDGSFGATITFAAQWIGPMNGAPVECMTGSGLIPGSGGGGGTPINKIF